MKRKKPQNKQQPSVGTQDTDDNTTRDMSRVQVVEEEKLKIEATSTAQAMADSEMVSEDKTSEEGQIAAKEEETRRREEELVRRLERLELEVRSQRARYSAGAEAGTGRGLDQGRRPSMSLSDGSRRDEEFRDRARAVM